FPKRILEEGAETQIDKINNTCRHRMLDMVRSVLKDEYEEVLQDPGELFPFISASGNSDVIDSDQFFREDEKNDERVGRIVALINAKQDWSEFEWEVQALPRNVELSDSEEGVDVGDVTETHVEEPSHVEELAVIARRGKRKINDPGAEARKKQLLCQWAAEHNSGISGQMKTFIEGLFTSLKEVVQKDIEERFDKVDKEMAQIKEVCLRFRVRQIQWEKKEPLRFCVLQQEWRKTNGEKHHRVCLLQQQRKKAKARQLRLGFLLRFVVALGQESLKDTDLPEDRVNDIDYSLVFVPEDSWVKLRKWCSTSKHELAARVMGPAVWLQNDALFDEIQKMDEQHSRMAKEIEDLRSSLNKTVYEEVMKQKNLADVGCLGSMLSILCLCSKRD
ncbi:hypothetical protein HID58_056115, partial [Brassica napus]